jgi:hypothetical protein
VKNTKIQKYKQKRKLKIKLVSKLGKKIENYNENDVILIEEKEGKSVSNPKELKKNNSDVVFTTHLLSYPSSSSSSSKSTRIGSTI